MKKITTPVILVTLLVAYGCHSKKAEADNGVLFDFRATGYSIGDPKFAMVLDIDAQLINDYADTVYFLSSTCEGEQYCLVYDENNLTLIPNKLCEKNNAVKIAIPPMEKHMFKARFNCMKGFDWIDIGFRFYKVDRNLSTNEISFDSFVKDIKDTSIIWPGKRLVHMIEMYK